MKAHYWATSLLAAGVLLGGCGSDSDSPSTAMYEVTLTNLTNAQPMSPMTVITHQSGEHLFTIGKPASIGLERLAEEGDNTLLLQDADEGTSLSGSGVIPPGESGSVILTAETSSCLSLLAMLVNTNDAFVGADCIDMSTLQRGTLTQMDLLAYDAGTEANSERAVTVPGPAGGGTGFDAARDDRDFVSHHAGIVGVDDGLADSALDMRYRWDEPVATITIERL